MKLTAHVIIRDDQGGLRAEGRDLPVSSSGTIDCAELIEKGFRTATDAPLTGRAATTPTMAKLLGQG